MRQKVLMSGQKLSKRGQTCRQTVVIFQPCSNGCQKKVCVFSSMPETDPARKMPQGVPEKNILSNPAGRRDPRPAAVRGTLPASPRLRCRLAPPPRAPAAVRAPLPAPLYFRAAPGRGRVPRCQNRFKMRPKHKNSVQQSLTQ